MSHPYYHSLSSVKKHGGCVEDYLPIHNWFDESKSILADYRHRAMRHHAEGIFMCEKIFGVTITNSNGKVIPVRIIGEQHVREDLGHIPSFADWARAIHPEPWMNKPQKLSKELETPPTPVMIDPPKRLHREEQSRSRWVREGEKVDTHIQETIQNAQKIAPFTPEGPKVEPWSQKHIESNLEKAKTTARRILGIPSNSSRSK